MIYDQNNCDKTESNNIHHSAAARNILKHPTNANSPQKPHNVITIRLCFRDLDLIFSIYFTNYEQLASFYSI